MAKVVSVTFNDNSDEVLSACKDQIYAWLEAIGQDASSTSADKAPVGTPESTGIEGYIGGTLKNSITHAVDQGSQCVYIGTNVEYAPYQEFGTSRGIVGKHFIQFGCTAHQAEYKAMLEEHLKQ